MLRPHPTRWHAFELAEKNRLLTDPALIQQAARGDLYRCTRCNGEQEALAGHGPAPQEDCPEAPEEALLPDSAPETLDVEEEP